MESGDGSISGTASTAWSPSMTRAASRAAAAATEVDVSPADVHVQSSEGDEDDSVPVAKKQKKCTSKVWLHFTKEEVTTKTPDGEEVTELWAKCNRCRYKARADSNRGTTAFRNHLKAKHNVKIGQNTLSVAKGEDGTPSLQISNRYDAEVSLRKWHISIIMHDYPFAMVEHEYFVDFIKSLRPGFSFKSRPTTRKLIIEMHVEEQQKLYSEFSSISSRFSATMDMWTSGQNLGYMCITVHWIDDNWKMQKRIVKFMHVKGNHSGKKLGNEFCKSLMHWNLEKKVFSLTLDNASSNDKCVEELVPILDKKSPLVCDGAFFHVRCLCHILNLVAQDGLKVIASSVRNIRATVTIVKNSTLQWEAFIKYAKEQNLDVTKGLSLDCTTRWNSTYVMLKDAIYYRKAFDKLLFLNKSKYKKCAIGDKEWDKAATLTKFLKKFYDATELFSASLHPTVNLFWRKFCEIKLAIDEWSRSKDAGISAMAKAMKEKYNKYWEKSNIALAVGCFLDPRYKKRLVEFFMSKIYAEESGYHMNIFMAAVNQLFEAYMSSGQDSEKTSTATTSVATQEGDDVFLDEMDEDIQNYLYDQSAQQDVEKSEIESYLKEDPVRWNEKTDGTFDILAWWKGKQGTYPVLARLARDVLAIQVSTVASESAFSAGGRVVDPFRTRLDPEVVEALICTKDWIAAGKRAIASLIDELEIVTIEPEIEPEASVTIEDEIIEPSSDESD